MVTKITQIQAKEHGNWLVLIRHNNNNYRFTTINSKAINKEDGEGDENLINEFLWNCREQIDERER
jgi:hypothetical protein